MDFNFNAMNVAKGKDKESEKKRKFSDDQSCHVASRK